MCVKLWTYGTFLECETMCRESPPGHVFVGSLAEIDQRKVAEVVRRSRDKKNNVSATHFFALSPKPIARFRWKRARLSLFRPQPHLLSFIQIHPSSWDLLAKTTFQIVTVIGDPIGYRITDKNRTNAIKIKYNHPCNRDTVNTLLLTTSR